MLRTQTILTQQLDAAEASIGELEESVNDLEEDAAAQGREVIGLQGKLQVADIKVEEAEIAVVLERATYSDLMDKARDLKEDRGRYHGAIVDWYNDSSNDICALCEIGEEVIAEVEL